MPSGELEITYGGQSRSTPSLKYITIKVILSNGTYVPQPNSYTMVVFYGRPPEYGSDYPVTEYYLYTNNLEFSGGINSIYSVAQVQSVEPSIRGQITAAPPLPFPVTIGIPGTGKVTTLQPGQTSVAFDIPLTGVAADEARGAVNAKLGEIRKTE